MLEIAAAEPLEGRTIRLTLTDGTVVDRDVSALLSGPLFGRLGEDEAAFRSMQVDYGTVVWPGELDIAPETLIWDGPAPADDGERRPSAFLRLHRALGG
jgi:hypothetical protein